MKPPASKWFVAPGPWRRNSQRKPIHGRLRQRRAGYIDTGWRAGVLDVDLEVVLQVLAHAGEVVDHGDAERLQLRGVADAGQLEQLRRVDGAAAADDLAGRDPLERARADPSVPCSTYSTPTARVPSNRMRLAWARQTTFRFGRRMTGWR